VLHAVVATAGCAEATPLPFQVDPTHSVTVGQDTSMTPSVGSCNAAATHVLGLEAGSAELNI
jgi:hypothetical protein